MSEAPATTLPLQIEAERLAHTLRVNVPSHRRVGYGEDYWRFRSYQGGEPATMIDWRQCARSTKLYVREKDRTPPQTVYLWADRSVSMHKRFSREQPTKAERAFVIIFALAHLLLRGGERVVWLDKNPLSLNGMTGFNALAHHLLPPQQMDIFPPIYKISSHAHIIICSDFASSIEQWEKIIRSYASLDARGTFCHIMSPEDEPSVKPLAPTIGNVGWRYLSHAITETPYLVLTHLFDVLTTPLREAATQENYTF